jgi:hypothetical protein
MAASTQQAIQVYTELATLIFKVFKIHVVGATPLTGNKGIFPDNNSFDIFLATKIRAKFKSPKTPGGVRVASSDVSPAIVATLAAVIADKLF